MGVVNRNNALYMATGIDNSGLQRGAREAEGIIDGLSNHAKKAGIAISSVFAIKGFQDFLTQMVNVRGEIQQLEIAFETMLNSKEKADAMMADIKKIALTTPFTLTEVADNTKQLIAMGIAADDVIGTMKALGDVAAGVSVPISRIAINYGQVAALGKLQSREIRDFAMAGIPIVGELATMLGKTSAEIQEMVEAGKIGFPEVEQAFKNMSGEGGRFYNLMEKQNASVTGQISKLQDEIQMMFNSLGEANQGIIYDAIGVASELVGNYEKIGKALAELIVLYGAYKSAIAFQSTFNNVVSNVKYIEEAKGLESLLTAEQKASISKQNLTRGTYEYAAAVKAATSANNVAAKEQVSILGQEASAQKAAMLAAKERAITANELVVQRQAELASIIGTAEVEKATALQKKIAIESEKQSRSALRAVKLQEQKDAAIQQAQSLKEAGATEQKITANNREIASIHNKLQAARAEEIQHAKNVTAIRAEINAVNGSITSKKIETAQKRLNTAVTAENTAVLERNTAMKTFYSQKIKIQTASQKAATIATVVDTAVQNSNIRATSLLSAAKIRLSLVAANLNKVLMANKFAIFAAAAIAAGYAIYKLITYQTEAEKSTKRLTKATNDYNKSIMAEKTNIDILFGRLRNAEEGTDAYRTAKKSIISQYGEYLNGLNEEIRTLKDVEGAYKAISSAAIQSAKDRAISQGTEQALSEYTNSWGNNIEKIQKEFVKKFGESQGTLLMDSLKDSLSNDKGLTEEVQNAVNSFNKTIIQSMGNSGATTSYETNPVSLLVSKIQDSKDILNNEVKGLEAIFGQSSNTATDSTDDIEKSFINVSTEVEKTKNKISELKDEIANLRSGKTQIEVGVSLPDKIDEKVKELNETEKVLATLTGIDKKTETKAAKDAEKSAKEQTKLQERINEEMRKFVEKNTSDRIALMDEGTQKEIAKIRDRYDKTMSEIQRQEAAWRKDQGGSLTAEQEVIIKSTKHTAESTAVKEEEDVTKQLLEKYQDYAAQREAIEKKFNKDIKALEDQRAIANEQGNAKMVESLDRAIAEATKNKGKELIAFDFNIFKESPEYVRAFEDLKNTSTATLTSLAGQLEIYKDKAAESLDPTELQAYTAAIQAIINELTERDPFGALAKAQDRLNQSTKKLKDAQKKLADAGDSGDTDKITAAQKEYNLALDENVKASNDAQKAQKKVINVVDQLYDSIAGVGDAIGGTAGDILNFIADIGKFVSITAEGMTTTAEGAYTAVQMIERASAILFIIQMAIQLISKLNSFIKDSHQQYLDYSKEIAQINALRDAVTNYEIAVTKARQAQESWFAEDRLQNLKNEWELNGKYLDAYNKKVNEQQAKYENEKGGGWLVNSVKWLGDAYDNTFGKVYDATVGKVSETFMGDVGKFIAKTGEAASFGLGTQASLDKYNKETVRAVDNLRIETKKKKKGFLGTGIGGSSQRTMDLREWARQNDFGELFDENDIIDISVAEAILKANEDGTIKLVGETEKTLETLVEYQKLYEEYQQQLQEYVSSLYSPLVDNLVDAIWDWFDTGKDALDSFREYAADTFREIASDMVRNLANKHIFADYDKEISDLYDKYFASDMTEADTEQLYQGIADATARLDRRIEERLPMLQDSVVTLDKSLQNIGINMKDDSEIKENTLKGAYAKASQESIDLLAGQTGAARVALEEMVRLMQESGDTAQLEQFKMFNDQLASIREMAVAGWNNVAAILEVSRRVEDVAVEVRGLNDRIADSNDAIQQNTKSAASSLQTIGDRGVKLLGAGLGK